MYMYVCYTRVKLGRIASGFMNKLYHTIMEVLIILALDIETVSLIK
jgi:hypothetical protein